MSAVNLIKRVLKINNERSLKALSGIFRTVIYKGGNMVINLLLVPLSMSFVGISHYGVWLTLSSIIAWFSISDIGFGNGLRNRFTEAVAHGDTLTARMYVSTAYISISILMFCGWFIFFVLNFFLDWGAILNISGEDANNISQIVLLVFSFFCLQLILKLVGTILIANQEPGKIAFFDFLSNVFILLGIYILVSSGVKGTLLHLAIISGSSQLVLYIFASIWFYSKSLKSYRPSFILFNKTFVHKLMGIGIKFFIVQMAAIFVFQCTNVIIVQVLGADDVTIYNIAYKYFTIPLTISLIVVSPIWSAFTDAYTKNDYVWMKAVFKKLIIFSLFIIILLLVFLLFSSKLYAYWIGSTVSIPFNISVLMMLNILVTSVFNIFIFIVNGTGKLYLQLWLTVVLSLVYIPLGVFLGRELGLPGIIGANFLINLVYAIVIPLQCYKLLFSEKKKSVWSK